MVPIVDIQNYSFQYLISDSPALKNINLQLEEGKFYSLIGPNGSGKTTLANAVRGFVPKFHVGDDQGDVYIFGQNMKDLELSDLANKVGFVFQNPFTQMSGSKKTVFDEIAFGLENLGLPVDEIVGKVNQIIAEADIEELRNKNPLELSGGQQQRVALAAVLVMEQPLMVIDEPTSQLDPQSTEDIFKMIEKVKESGKTVLLIEHKIDQIAEFSDEVIVMDEGEIKLQGSPKEVFQSPLLKEIDVAIPTPSKLSLELYEHGINFTDVPITIDELCQQIVNHGRRRLNELDRD